MSSEVSPGGNRLRRKNSCASAGWSKGCRCTAFTFGGIVAGLSELSGFAAAAATAEAGASAAAGAEAAGTAAGTVAGTFMAARRDRADSRWTMTPPHVEQVTLRVFYRISASIPRQPRVGR